jgi:hypothetical protein
MLVAAIIQDVKYTHHIPGPSVVPAAKEYPSAAGHVFKVLPLKGDSNVYPFMSLKT